MRTSARMICGFAGVAALWGGPTPVRAEDELRPRLEIAAGVFFATNRSEIAVDSPVRGAGTRIDLEDDLGLDEDETTWRVDARLRLGEQRRHRIDASYFRFSRSAQRTVDRQIQFRDTVFDVDAELRAELDLNIFKLNYTYMFLQRDTYEIGGSIGIFGIDQSASLSDARRNIAESSNVTFPLPTLGLRGEVDLWRGGDVETWPRVSLKGSIDAFFIDTGDYDGELYDALVAVELGILDHLAAGLGYSYADLDLGASRGRGDVGLGASYDGALVYLKWMQ